MDNRLLIMKDISKSFPGVKALQKVNLELSAGEVHALMGENGAGKSTLMKILSGMYKKEDGEIYIEGKKININTPLEAQENGISTVFQELNLIPHLSVYENMMIGREIRKGFFIDKKATYKKAKDIMENVMGLSIPLNTEIKKLSAATQQMVSIARAVSINCKILILDEPTSSLDKKEVAVLFSVIRRLKSNGIGIIYISHKMEEIFNISDSITILRDGKYINTHLTAQTTKLDLICEMIGKDAGEIVNYKKSYNSLESNENILSLKNISSVNGTTNLSNIDITVKRGEILGLSGLLGSGRTEITNVIFGIDKNYTGSINLFGQEIPKSEPKNIIKLGVGLIPEERRKSGIIPSMSVKENITLPLLKELSKYGFINKEQENIVVKEYIEKLSIKVSNMDQQMKNLSGGNQQKAIIARWLAKDSDFLIMDEPTRGIDIGAKSEIEKIIKDLVHKDKSILMISSEIEEMVRSCDRIYTIVDGAIVKELVAEEITESNIINAIATTTTNEHSEVKQ